MASIPDDKVQEVRDRIEILDLIGRYVQLRKAGQNYKGLCPFHQEKTPSFNVNPQRKGYKCFGCGAGGDGIGFVMEVEGKSFPEAVRTLAELYGVVLPAGSRGGASDPARQHEKDEAYKILRRATELYETILWDDKHGAAGRSYLEARGISEELARRFRLGYAPAPSEAGWDTLCKALAEIGAESELTRKLGLVGHSERSGNLYDKFRGRLMFPVIQAGGEPVAFSGRIVPPHDEDGKDGDPPPKYMNSSESLLFKKSKQLFGLATARAAIRSKKQAILVEGNVDVVKLHQWGHEQTMAPLGTALTEDQARLLTRFADTVIMCFDGDKAGKKAAWAALPLLLEVDLDVRMVLLPEGEDPDSVGEERFGALLARAKPALEQMMIKIAAKAGEAAHARGKALDRVLPLIATVPRPSSRELFANRAAELFGLPLGRVEQALRGQLSGSGPRDDSRQKPSTSRGPVPVSAAVRSVPSLPAGQAQLAMLLVDVPHLASIAERSGAAELVTDERLAPLVRRVLEGAKAGEDPNLTDLLDLVDVSSQQEVYRQVFAGRYRGLDEGADPQAILRSLVHRCREDAIEHQIRELDHRIQEAQDAGYPDKASELAQQRLALRREQMILRQQPPAPAEVPSA